MNLVVPTRHILKDTPNELLKEFDNLLTYLLEEINENGLDVNVGDLVSLYFAGVSKMSNEVWGKIYLDMLELAENITQTIFKYVESLECKGVVALDVLLLKRVAYDIVVYVELVNISHGVDQFYKDQS